MPKLYSLARMSTATTGTGTITLGSAVTGFLTFTQAGVADGDVVTYAIADGINSEIGRGTYTASGTTLTRSVLRSTNGNAAVSLSGTAQVFITAAAEDLRFKLTSATAFFVDSVNGNDNNDGLAAGTGRALATIQGAINLLQSKYDLNGQNLTIKTTTSGSYAPFVVKSDFVGAGTVTIVGSPNLAITAATNANPSVITAPGHDYANGDHYIGSGALGNTAINGAFKVANANIGAGTFTLVNENTGAAIAGSGAYAGGGTCSAPSRVTISGSGQSVTAQSNSTPFSLVGFKLSSSNAQLVMAWKGGAINLGKNQYDAPGPGVQQLWATQNGRIVQIDNYSISGSGGNPTGNFMQASHGGNIRQESSQGTIIANLTYDATTGFLYSDYGDITTTASPGGIPWNPNGFSVNGSNFRSIEWGVIQVEGSYPPTQSIVPGAAGGVVLDGPNPCRVYLAANQTGNAMNAYTKINFDTVDYDPDTQFDTANHRIIAKWPGTYLVTCTVDDVGSGTGVPSQAGAVGVSKNGTRIQGMTVAVYNNGIVNETFVQCSAIVRMNGTTDFVEGLGGAFGAAGTVTFNASGSNGTTLSCVRIGP